MAERLLPKQKVASSRLVSRSNSSSDIVPPFETAGDEPPADSQTDWANTLPDLLRDGLSLVFVGINPSVYSVEKRHYFARPTNRFWPALSRSDLSAPIRQALGREVLVPTDDSILLDFGIGFTDVVKRPTRNVGQLSPEDFRSSAPKLMLRLASAHPLVACFHGVMGYRPFLRHGLGKRGPPGELGAQDVTLGETRIFVVPSPSPANAHFRLEDQILWYDRLAEFCAFD